MSAMRVNIAKKGNEGWRVCSRFDREGIIVVTAQACLIAETYTRMCTRDALNPERATANVRFWKEAWDED